MKELSRPRAVWAVLAPALALLAAVVLPTTAAVAQRQVPPSREAVNYSFAPIVKRVLPAVVNVYVRHKTQTVARHNPFFDDPFFRQFFGDSFGVPRERMEASLGSGVIIDENGLVVTNNHVIEGASNGEIKVALPNKAEYNADILIADKNTDLAVLKLKAGGEKFPFLELANSDAVEVGDMVLAMGNPFGVGQTVTSGIVSALARTGIGDSEAQYFIQTDAAINPGNSGGPLVDMNGQVVGINTAIFSKSGGSLGIGFAIPSNMVRLVVNSARSGTAVRRPWFGGQVESVNRNTADALGLSRLEGAYVATLGDQGPARRAGLQVGDVILAVNGHEVQDATAFRYHYSINGIGGSADLTVWRGGQQIHKTVELISAPEVPPREETMIRGRNPFSGAQIANLSPALAEETGMSEQSGVVILRVDPASLAGRIGIAEHDIILEVNNVEIETVGTLNEVLQRSWRGWDFTIKRGDNVLTMNLGG
jgi:serine protease Do